MKKYYQSTILSLFAAFLLVLFNSCEEDTVQSGYSYGIESYETSYISVDGGLQNPDNPLKIITEYLEEVKCYVTDEYTFMYFESETKAENVEKAINYFNVNVDKIDEVEFEKRMEGLDAKFTYVLIGEAPDSKEVKFLKSKEFKFGSYKE